MYLAKFFHRAPGNDDRELLLILDSSCSDGHALMGFVMNGASEPYRRHDVTTARGAVAAFRRAAEDLRQAGYIETADTKYTLRSLPRHPKPKPAWQQELDELMLSAIIEDAASQTALIAKLAKTPAAQEPLYLWLAARHAFESAPSGDIGALARAESARDVLGARRASKAQLYVWSMRPLEIEAFIHDLLCEIHFAAGDPQAGLDAARHAQDVAGDQYRGGRIAWILCNHFPERAEEAFEQAYRYAEFGGYEAVTALPAYAAYAERRKRSARVERPWRWGGRSEAASEHELHEAEDRLGAALPRDYRRFLLTARRSELLVHVHDRMATVRFFAASQLVRQRDSLFRFIIRTERSPAKAEAYFLARYGVSLHDLVPIAGPANLSRNIVIHLGKGERFGWCFRWDHDGAWELDDAQPSFEHALASLTSGIERRDFFVLQFLGLEVE
jgi:hypothetical protein